MALDNYQELDDAAYEQLRFDLLLAVEGLERAVYYDTAATPKRNESAR